MKRGIGEVRSAEPEALRLEWAAASSIALFRHKERHSRVERLELQRYRQLTNLDFNRSIAWL